MLCPEALFASLAKNGIDFFAGVPDSLLKEFLFVLEQRAEPGTHHICANEGAAVALATGYHLSSGKLPLVYMQNSGLGNAVNPLFSLTHQMVYSTPLLLLIGWRGEPGTHDEPQHRAAGAKTPALLDLLGIPFEIVDSQCSDIENLVSSAVERLKTSSSPYALIISKSAFQPTEIRRDNSDRYELSREEAIKIVLHCLSGQEVIVCTTGKASRELYELRETAMLTHAQDFLNVGAMGHTSQIALGIAIARPKVEVVCIDGDGAAIMHMGAFATIGNAQPRNLKHVLINNGVHDSVGGQPTAGFFIDFTAIASACGYRSAARCDKAAELPQAVSSLLRDDGPSLLEIRVNSGGREKLARPPESLQTSKREFMDYLCTFREDASE